ncbi:hypothetical protein EJB05_25792, partial [Eragrostis curvula]
MAAVTPWRAPTMLVVLLAAVMIGLLSSPASAALENKTEQVTVFWGRNKNEGPLQEACDTGRYTTVIISFLDVYGVDGKYHLDLSGHPPCRVGDDIKHCHDGEEEYCRGGLHCLKLDDDGDASDKIWSWYKEIGTWIETGTKKSWKMIDR